MPFTQPQMDAAATYALDFHIKGPAHAQTIQDKPLLAAMKGAQSTFPGGKGKITTPVVGDFLDGDANFFKGFSYGDTVAYQNPNNDKRAEYQWCEIHAGIEVPFTELKQNGISVVDTAFGEKTAPASEQEKILLTDVLDSKLLQMSEGWARKFNAMLWRDGTQDSGKQTPGITAYILDTPAVGTTGGFNRATTPWWRNRAGLGLVPGNGALLKKLKTEVRQLKRYGGKPNLILAGSAFLEALEDEVVAKSYFSMDGMAKKHDLSSPGLWIKGIGEIQYDPTLDDLQTITAGVIDYSKRCYFIDTDSIKLKVMDGEDNKTHSPARSETKYSLFRSMTWTGGTMARRLNSSGVYSIA